MFGLYVEKYKNVQDDYLAHDIEIKKVEKHRKPRTTKKDKLKIGDPVTEELFGKESYYPSSCIAIQQPTKKEVPEDYPLDYPDNYYRFLLENQSKILFPIPKYKGKQSVMSCEKYNAPYAGLKENKSKKARSKMKHPYIPCCFKSKVETRNKPKGIKNITEEYFEGKYDYGSKPKSSQDNSRKQRHLSTMKILSKDQTGNVTSSVLI